MTSDKRIPAARIREAWLDHSKTTAAGAAEVGLSRAKFSRRAKAMGLPSRQRASGHRLVVAEFVATWADPMAANDEIAARFGYSARHVMVIARRLQMPPRKLGAKLRYDVGLFSRLWRAGVSLREIGDLFGRDRSTLSAKAKGLGLPPRHAGWQPSLTLSAWREMEFAARLAESARETREAMASARRAEEVASRRLRQEGQAGPMRKVA